MRKIYFLTLILSIIFLIGSAQDIKVALNEKGILQIPKKDSSFRYKLPFSLFFDESEFKGKSISFYSAKNDSKKFEEAQFGNEISKKDLEGKSIYEIKVKKDMTIDVKDNKTVLSDGIFYFRINKSAFSSPIKLEKHTLLADKGYSDINRYKPGFIFNDAVVLNNLKGVIHKAEDSAVIRTILRFYQIDDSTKLSVNKFLDNELKNAFDEIPEVQKEDGGEIQNATDGITSVISSIGGLDVTNIADGFAKFIVKRTKEELSIAFFEKFKKELERYPDLKTVFPTSYNLLQSIDQQIYNYTNYINNLREAFRSDLQVLDENLPGIIENHTNFFNKKTNFQLGLALRTGCYVTTSLKHDMHPGDVLDGYPLSFFDKSPPEDKAGLDMLKGSIESLQLLSESLKEGDTSKHTYWVSADKIQQLVNDKDALKIYLGLFLQVAKIKYDSVKFGNDKNLYTILNTDEAVKKIDEDYNNYNAYKQYILSFGNKVAELNKMIKDYEKPASDSLKVEQYAKFFKTSVQFIQYCVQVSTLPYIKDIDGVKDLSKNTEKYFNVAYETTNLTTAINRKRYPEAVNNLVIIYNTVVAKPAKEGATFVAGNIKLSDKQKIELADKLISENSIDPLRTAGSVINQVPEVATIVKNDDAGPLNLSIEQKINLADKLISEGSTDPTKTVGSVIEKVTEVPPLIKDKDANAGTTSTVLAAMAKYGAFMSSMIDAKTSNEVESAIEAVALPTGSARIKRVSLFNVSLNAYCGLFVGHEKITDVKDNQMFNAYGVTAPIGVSLSTGTTKGWSHTAFISLIDLGAITAFRFTDNTTEQVPTIQLKNIFSPGIFYSLGIANSPLSVNLGAQIGPNLRKVTKDNNDYSGKTYIRYSLSFCVDLPLLNLYTKSR